VQDRPSFFFGFILSVMYPSYDRTIALPHIHLLSCSRRFPNACWTLLFRIYHPLSSHGLCHLPIPHIHIYIHAQCLLISFHFLVHSFVIVSSTLLPSPLDCSMLHFLFSCSFAYIPCILTGPHTLAHLPTIYSVD